MNRIRLTIIVLALVALGLGGCANVQTWEHGAMADYKMKRDRDPLKTAIDEHTFFSREAATGGQGIGGPGCGCN